MDDHHDLVFWNRSRLRRSSPLPLVWFLSPTFSRSGEDPSTIRHHNSPGFNQGELLHEAHEVLISPLLRPAGPNFDADFKFLEVWAQLVVSLTYNGCSNVFVLRLHLL